MPEFKTVIADRAADSAAKVDRTILVALAPWKIAGIRALRVYLQSLVGFLLAGGSGAAGAVGITMPVGDFGALLVSCASLAVAPAAISLIQNVIELLAKIDQTNPTLRG